MQYLYIKQTILNMKDRLVENYIKSIIKETIQEVLNEYGDDPNRPDGAYNIGRVYTRKNNNNDTKGAEEIYNTFQNKMSKMNDADRDKMNKAFNRGRYDQDEHMAAQDGRGKVPNDAYQYKRPHLGPIGTSLRKTATGRTIKKNMDTYSKNKDVKPIPRKHKVH